MPSYLVRPEDHAVVALIELIRLGAQAGRLGLDRLVEAAAASSRHIGHQLHRRSHWAYHILGPVLPPPNPQVAAPGGLSGQILGEGKPLSRGVEHILRCSCADVEGYRAAYDLCLPGLLRLYLGLGIVLAEGGKSGCRSQPLVKRDIRAVPGVGRNRCIQPADHSRNSRVHQPGAVQASHISSLQPVPQIHLACVRLEVIGVKIIREKIVSLGEGRGHDRSNQYGR